MVPESQLTGQYLTRSGLICIASVTEISISLTLPFVFR
jgi:hypothetical protein